MVGTISRINFISISGRTVTADYANLPDGFKVLFVSKTSGERMSEPVTVIGTVPFPLVINLPDTFPSGDYFLIATGANDEQFAESVEFYVG
ncbi:hypothetical protein [uncultured Bradyrhizobium sp.]|uniref:hypothetical protein n=1 Tax=uncultured Bradyrhizobium sp. TaxID=199684 RepID=UPI0035CAEEF0